LDIAQFPGQQNAQEEHNGEPDPESQGFGHTAGRIKHVRMGDDPEKAAEDQIGQTVGMVGVDQLFEPCELLPMVR